MIKISVQNIGEITKTIDIPKKNVRPSYINIP